MLDVYAAREDPEPGVTGALVADAVPGGRAVVLAGPARACRARSPSVAKPGDLVLTMGAGDVTALGPQIVAPCAAGRTAADEPGGRCAAARQARSVEGGVLRPGGRWP